MSDQPSGGLVNAMNEAPAWTKSVLVIGTTFGIPTLLIAFYLAQDAGILRNPVAEELKDVHRELQEIKGQGIQHDTTMRELTKVVEAQARQLQEEAKGRQMRCILRAQTEADKKACFPNGKE